MRTTRRLSLYGLLAMLLAVAAAGCEPVNAEASSSLATSAGELSADRGQRPATNLELERRIKASAAGPLAIYRPLDWPTDPGDLEAAPRLQASALPMALREQLAASELPVLLPSDPELLEVAVITTGDGWHAVAMSLDDYGVSLNATRVVQRLPIPLDEPLVAPTRRAPRVTISEATPVLTFDEGGVSWLLIVECAAPLTDPRCAGEAFIRDLADGLALVEGGAP